MVVQILTDLATFPVVAKAEWRGTERPELRSLDDYPTGHRRLAHATFLRGTPTAVCDA